MEPDFELSTNTIDAIDFDSNMHVDPEVHRTFGAGSPFSFGALLSLLAPFILQAIQSLASQGTKPGSGAILAKAAELAKQKGA